MKIKICGLFRTEDIAAVNRFKPDYCGFIINFPKSHRNLAVNELSQLSENVSKSIKRVGVFVNQSPDFIAELVNDGLIDIPQLHGDEDPAYITSLRDKITSPVWKAFQIKSEADVAMANSSNADFVILDAGQGSGNSFNWELLNMVTRPFGLAGGISPDNLDEALKTGAQLIDISGGAETDRLKDATKISELVSRCHSRM